MTGGALCAMHHVTSNFSSPSSRLGPSTSRLGPASSRIESWSRVRIPTVPRSTNLGIETLRVDAKVIHNRNVSNTPLGPTFFDNTEPNQATKSPPDSFFNVSSSPRLQSALSISQGWIDIATDRSSIYSLDDEELEQQASNQIKTLFNEIDEILYEKHWGSPSLQTECSEWSSVFPYLRIVGKQLKTPDDNGWQILPAKMPSKSLNFENSTVRDSTETNNLSLGSSLFSPLSSLSLHGNQLSVHRQLLIDDEQNNVEEEIIESDGCLEDIIAIDNDLGEEESANQFVSQRHSCQKYAMPPITPQECIKDNIRASLFGHLWSQISTAFKSVLQEYRGDLSTTVLQDYRGDSEFTDDQELEVHSDISADEKDKQIVPITMSFPENIALGYDILPPSRDLSNMSSIRQCTTIPKRQPSVSRFSTGLSGSSQSQNTNTVNTVTLHTNDEMQLFVSGKNLMPQNQEKSCVSSIPSEYLLRQEQAAGIYRPNSSISPHKPISSEFWAANLRTPEFGHYQSSRGRSSVQNRFLPPPGVKTSLFLADHQLEMIGQGMPMEQIMSKTPQRLRYGSLPPLLSEVSIDTTAGVLLKKQQRHQVSSAVHVHADEKSLGYERLQRRQNTDLLNMQVDSPTLLLNKRTSRQTNGASSNFSAVGGVGANKFAHGVANIATRQENLKFERNYACMSSMSHVTMTKVMSPLQEISPRNINEHQTDKISLPQWGQTSISQQSYKVSHNGPIR